MNLQIDANNSLNIKYHKIVLTILLTITSLPILLTNASHYLLLILSFVSIIALLLKSEVKINAYIVWMVVVGIIFLSSIFWAVDSSLTLGQLKAYLINLSMFVYLSLLIRTRKDIYTALKIFIFSRLIMMIYILIVLDFSSLGVMRIGAGSLGEEWNANVIGMNLALAAYATFVLIREQSNIRNKLIYGVFLISFSAISLLTGSRKALFILVFSIALYILMISGKKLIRNIFIYSSIFIIFIYLIFNNPFLYNVLGSRVDGLLATFTGQSIVDGSTEIRNLMIREGIQFFGSQPILGYGLNNYRVLLEQSTGYLEYAHNNYIELLVGIGLIGTIIYYSIFYYILRNSFKKINKYSAFSIVLVLTLLIIDYGLVSYNAYYINFFICLAFSSMVFSSEKKCKSINSFSNARLYNPRSQISEANIK